MKPDGTKNGLIHAKVLNLKVGAVKGETGKDENIKENKITRTCHPIGPFPKAKLVCVESIGLCRLACRRHYNNEYGSILFSAKQASLYTDDALTYSLLSRSFVVYSENLC